MSAKKSKDYHMNQVHGIAFIERQMPTNLNLVIMVLAALVVLGMSSVADAVLSSDALPARMNFGSLGSVHGHAIFCWTIV